LLSSLTHFCDDRRCHIDTIICRRWFSCGQLCFGCHTLCFLPLCLHCSYTQVSLSCPFLLFSMFIQSYPYLGNFFQLLFSFFLVCTFSFVHKDGTTFYTLICILLFSLNDKIENYSLLWENTHFKIFVLFLHSNKHSIHDSYEFILLFNGGDDPKMKILK
jgi:hypothetical protein